MWPHTRVSIAHVDAQKTVNIVIVSIPRCMDLCSIKAQYIDKTYSADVVVVSFRKNRKYNKQIPVVNTRSGTRSHTRVKFA